MYLDFHIISHCFHTKAVRPD